MDLRKDVNEAEAIAKRVEAALNGWYEKHFHNAVKNGAPAITAEQHDELKKVVASAVQPASPEPAKSPASEQD